MVENRAEKPQIVPLDCKKALPYGLKGEGLSEVYKPAQRHTDGAREARIAQQF